MSMFLRNRDETKSLLAKLLATENIVVRHQPLAPTANFDIKSRILTLPVWKGISEDLYDLLVIHEVGHALHTPAKDWMEKLPKITEKIYGKCDSKRLAAVHAAVNILEDVRIDRLQKIRYPGCRKNYAIGYRELFDRDFFGVKDRDLNSLGFLDRLNIYYKGGVLLGIDFTDEEKALLEEANKTVSFGDVTKLAEEVLKFIKDKSQDQPGDGDGENSDDQSPQKGDGKESSQKGQSKGNGQSKPNSSSNKEAGGAQSQDQNGESSGEDAGSGSDGEDSEGEDDAGNGTDGHKDDVQVGGTPGGRPQDETGDSSGSGEDGEGAGDSADKLTKTPNKTTKGIQWAHDELLGEGAGTTEAIGTLIKAGNSRPVDPDEEVPDIITQEAFDGAAKSLTQASQLSGKVEYAYARIPRGNLDLIVDDFKEVLPDSMKFITKATGDSIKDHRRNLQAFRDREKQNIAFMLKEFEMRKAADRYARTYVAKTGVLNTSKLHKYKYSEDIFRKQEIETTGKNHGFVMVVDWSGSMGSNLVATVQQTLLLALFCRQAQIPFEVFIFRDLYSVDYRKPKFRKYSGYTNNLLMDMWKTEAGQENNTIYFDPLKLRNMLSSRMNAQEFNDALLAFWTIAALGGNAETDPLTGTPLDQTIVALSEVVKEFQRKNQIQIVNTIILTDGESSGSGRVGLDSATWNSHPKITVFEDAETKTTIDPNQEVRVNGGRPSATFRGRTDLFLKVLKNRTKSNLIGFFLTSGSWDYSQYSFTSKEKVDLNALWKKENYVGITHAGYDEYYLINAPKMGVRNIQFDPKGLTNASDSVKTMTAAFSEYLNQVKRSRILLQKFVARISVFDSLTKKNG